MIWWVGKSLHRNGLTTIEVFWVNFFTKYLTYFCIITCSLAVKLLCQLTTCHVIYLHNYFSKNVNMRKMKIQFFNFLNVIFWMKIQNAAWFQYKTFSCCNYSFLDISILINEGHVLTWSGDRCLWEE